MVLKARFPASGGSEKKPLAFRRKKMRKTDEPSKKNGRRIRETRSKDVAEKEKNAPVFRPGQRRKGKKEVKLKKKSNQKKVKPKKEFIKRSSLKKAVYQKISQTKKVK
ncbi:MAG: hypothetical protein LBJ64_12820 [Deltaproteobacteria bacterium]|jgi:hypothetical protein|nr:hypothetical protein [Deltaproteobacteria bacterium]